VKKAISYESEYHSHHMAAIYKLILNGKSNLTLVPKFLAMDPR